MNKQTGPNERRLRVLLSAYACEPDKSSEQGVGWNWAVALSTHCDVSVVTRANNRIAIEAACETDPLLRKIQWHYHDLGHIWLSAKRIFRCHRLYYTRWQTTLSARLKTDAAFTHYDILHHITFASYRYTPAISGLDGLTVWGPVGGAERTPWNMLPWRQPSTLFYEIMRNVQTRRSRSSRVARNFSKVLVSTCETRALLSEIGVSTELFPTIGLSNKQIEKLSRKVAPEVGKKLLYVGNLQFLKGIHFAIQALALTSPDTTLTIVGSGSYETHLRRLSASLSLETRVTFIGKVPRNQLVQIYHDHDLFIFPSLHDSGGIALLEAMASSMPSISLACGGPRVIADATCGVQIPPISERSIVQSIASAIQNYFENPHLVQKHGSAARARVIRDFTWEKKARRMVQVYQELESLETNGPPTTIEQ